MRMHLLVFAFVALVAASMAFPYAHSANASASFSTELNATMGYISMVNKSAYIIFYPNLTAAYNYVSEAKKAASTDPQRASALLADAKASASVQLSSIYRYRTESVVALAAFSVALAILIYLYMRPSRQARNNYRR
ncbi:MAG: hypothetical protein M1360_04120 [Candidatus Marsarchaeota archaeon]|jgi:hypothetical protein|nr:hypothetical protein [Candidatus Marsarchaeota archaeon]MCL5419095.1 hypothetical protein [Candidatus Marsarchaeota archaeon]